jgi:hypothetical protein
LCLIVAAVAAAVAPTAYTAAATGAGAGADADADADAVEAGDDAVVDVEGGNDMVPEASVEDHEAVEMEIEN